MIITYLADTAVIQVKLRNERTVADNAVHGLFTLLHIGAIRGIIQLPIMLFDQVFDIPDQVLQFHAYVLELCGNVP